MTAEPVPDAPVAALWCSERAPFVELALCRRLVGHSGLHRSDDSDDWADLHTPTTERSTAVKPEPDLDDERDDGPRCGEYGAACCGPSSEEDA